MTTAPEAAPVLRWPGGKRAVIKQLLTGLPEFDAYYEPFVGGGALFFALYNAGLLKGREVFLSDLNGEVIDLYRALRDDFDDLLRGYDLLVATYTRMNPADREAYYYALRDGDVAPLPRIRRAARTLFLNAAGFNGLYRVNSNGKFNVPFGDGNVARLKSESALVAAARALQGVKLRQCSFVHVTPTRHALVYADPPFADVPGKKSFRAYTAEGFSDEQQAGLADWCARASSRHGAHVMASNTDCKLIRALYPSTFMATGHWYIERVKVKRSINRDGKGRGGVGEVIIRAWR